MTRLLMIVVAVMFGVSVQAAQEVKMADGRSYLIDMPRGAKTPPLIIVLHGGGGSGAYFVKVTGMSPVANKAGFAVIYPNGSGRGRFLTWNAGYCCAYAAQHRVDDIGFLARVIDDAARRFGTSRSNVFVTGMSNGGMMAETMAAKRPDLIRAAASVSGPLDLQNTRPSKVPLLHIHGTADDVVPYNGGPGDHQIVGTSFPPVEDVIAAWVRAQGVRLQATQQTIDPVRRDRTSVLKTTYSSHGSPRVVFYRVDGGSHSWPGSPRAGRKGISKDINASAEIVKFFASHVR